MTWKHVALVALAIVLVLLCGRSTVCSAPGTFQGVITLATTIVAIAGGNATLSGREAKKKPPPKEKTP